ncbi:hypothetical protein HYFRA_00011828 [Hymenoscyphus fraxineus]|uniref:Uncharacterized protein n=1 Tax=Hymenoscyphus fraxineus TaxID=746836 RepID=A0A9N9L6Z9_9HELO|nr:hypothetical protein HYFRA_00011828 [Hymenoscyphus fraxineus]
MLPLTNSTIAAIATTTLALLLTAAYLSGVLDPAIKEVGIMFFKAKAEAEARKLRAQGWKQGEDFTKGQLEGNKQAADVAEGFGKMGGGVSGLKVGL